MAKFESGKSGNPGGRPKITLPDGRSLRDVAREHTVEAITALVQVIREGESEAARVSAINAILDRGWGKPTQPISGDDEMPPLQHTVNLTGLSEQALRELAALGEKK